MNDYHARREKELAAKIPFSNGSWNLSYLYEYLVEVNYGTDNIALRFFGKHLASAELAGILLKEFLLNEDYDGSESQLGAAVILRRMDRSALRPNRELVLLAQNNETAWKRPLSENECPDWLS